MNKILNQVQTDFEQSKQFHNLQLSSVQSWRDEYNGLPYGNETKGRAELISRDIYKAVETAIPSLVEPFLSDEIIDLQGQDAESDQKAEVVESLLNYQWRYSTNALHLMENIARTLMVDATVVLKCSWEGSCPTSELIRLDDIYFDGTSKLFKDSKFVIEKKRVTIGEILDNQTWYGKHTLESLQSLQVASNYNDGGITDYDIDLNINFEDRLRQIVDINIFYGSVVRGDKLVPSVVIWSDDFLINKMDNPYPDSWNNNPFCVEGLTSGVIYGTSIAEALSDNQKINTGIKRAVLDTLDSSANGQKAVQQGTIDPVNEEKWRNGEFFKYKTPDFKVWEGRFAEIPQHLMGLQQSIDGENAELTGVSKLNGGLDPRALTSGVSATASSLVQTNAERKLLLFTRHITSLLEGMFRKWIDLNSMMLERGSIRFGNEFIDLTSLDLEGNFDVMLNISSQSMKREKAQSLSQTIQMLSAHQVPRSITMELLSEYAKALDMHSLSNQLKDLATQEQQAMQEPQESNPLEQMSMELEMQEQQSVINKNNSKAELDKAKSMESFVDLQNKSYGL